MGLVKIKCINCGDDNEIVSVSQTCFCQGCGAILEIEKFNSKGLEKEVEMLSEFDIQLAAVKEIEGQYFSGTLQFSDVLLAYEDTLLMGANKSDYWIERARFYVTGNLKEFAEGRVLAASRKNIVEEYVLLMEKAIEKYVGNPITLKMEREKTIGDINNSFGVNGVNKKEYPEELFIPKAKRQECLADEADLVVEGLEIAENKRKKIAIIFVVVGVVVLFLFAVLLRSCGNNDGNYNVTYYEEFLELSNVLDLLNGDSTRLDILDLDVNFGNQDVDAGALRVIAPQNSDLESIVFHFNEDDILAGVLITNAEYFNGFAAINGFSDELTQHIEADFAEEFELNDDVLNFVTSEFDVVLTSYAGRFNINISRDESGLMPEQQMIWNLIEARIEEGYDSWSDLIDWVDELDIPFIARENGERPIVELLSLINEYGLIGDYISVTPGLEQIEEEYEVVLFIDFENLSYNHTIAELSALNRSSGSELTTWLGGGGLLRLESHFEEVEILNFDYDGEILTEMPEVVEFVNWEIDFFDRFMPVGAGLVRIERIYRVIEIEEPEETEEEEIPVLGGTITLNAGTWLVGADITQGRYVITGSNSGSLLVWRGDTLLVSEVLGGGNTGVSSVTTYLLNGDKIEINGISNTIFTPANRTLSRTLGTGNWIVGVDIVAGQFYATTSSGSGNLVIWRGSDMRTNENLSADLEAVRVELVAGDIITVSGLERVNFD